MKTRSIRFDVEDLKRADLFDLDVNDVARKAVKKANNIAAANLPLKSISFKKICSCGNNLDQTNCLLLKMTEMGVWFTCPKCESTGMTGSYKINYKK